jgi:transposase
VNKKKKIAIQNEVASIRQKYEEKKNSLPAEAVTIIELLFGLFNLLLLTMGIVSTSQNSHLPPSQDPHRSRASKKKSGKKKKGGQVGHKGKTLRQVENPDQIIFHPVTICESCGSSLLKLKCTHITKHQVFDYKFQVVVTEHQAEHKSCECGHLAVSKLPEGVSAPCQYGPSVKAMAVELTQVQFVPLKRASEFFANKLGLSVSQSSITNFNQEAFEKLQDWKQQAKKNLIEAEVLNGDETGIKIDKKLAWIHSLSNDLVVLMEPHFERGSEAMNAMGILPQFHSILCHDFWSAYSAYDVIHAACHAHIERELKKSSEDYGQKWAKKLTRVLQRANKLRNAQDGVLTYKQVRSIESRYDKILRDAQIECPQNMIREYKRGRIKQIYPRQLLNRLILRKSWVLMFLYDPRVPFTNNQAERDIRMAKVQQKVSGCFRTFEGAERFCLVRSFVLSMNRQGKNVQAEIEALFRGR